MGEKKNSDRSLEGKPEGKKPPGRLTCRVEDVTKMDLK
jgi:hypothetical protein